MKIKKFRVKKSLSSKAIFLVYIFLLSEFLCITPVTASMESFDTLGVEKQASFTEIAGPKLFDIQSALAPLKKFQSDICANRKFAQADLANFTLYNNCYPSAADVELIPKGLYDFENRTPPWEQLQSYANTTTAQEFKTTLNTYINLDQSLGEYLQIEENSLRIRNQTTGPFDLVQLAFAPTIPQKIPLTSEFFRSRPELTQQYGSLTQLKNLRVAIDPGHIGGKWSEFEERHLKVGGNVIREGDLTFKTAATLKKFLEDQGAQVFLTRQQAGDPGHPFELGSFNAGALNFITSIKLLVPALAKRLNEVGVRQAPTAAAIKLYNQLLLFYAKRGFIAATWSYRVEKLNAQNPDLIFFIHYNAGSKDNFSGPQKLMSFVKGTVEKHRVLNPYFRYRAIKDTLRGDLFDAGVFAHTTMHTMSQAFKEPVLNIGNWEDKTVMRAVLPNDIAVATQKSQTLGVYAWNLGVMRYPDAPAVLFEGTYMNHITEKYRLISDYAKPMFDPSTRMTQYAGALLRSIKLYAGQMANSKLVAHKN